MFEIIIAVHYIALHVNANHFLVNIYSVIFVVSNVTKHL